MPSRRARRRTVLGAVLLLLALVIVPPYVRVNRYREELAGSLSRALGREVRVGEISLQLVPQPGFEVTNLVIMDDPAFSAEPMVQAESVTAALRISSLFRRKLEIAKLSLQYTSFNLVRNTEGRWNLEALLTRAAQTPTAPTAATPETRPRFPYIEAEDARVNFKLGDIKKPYALSQADFAVWLEAGDQWNMRLTAVPVRTDLSLTDSATLRVTGSVRRAEKLRDMALDFRAEIEHAQMGQITRFVYGADRGWRGEVDLGVTLAGTASDLQVVSDATLRDFRRYDIATRDSAELRIRCGARFDGLANRLHQIECGMPVGDGDVIVRGSIANLDAHPEFDLSLAARRVPMSAVLTAVRRAKRDMSTDLAAGGELAAAFVLRTETVAEQKIATLVGGGETRDLVLRGAALDPPLRLGALRFAVVNEPGGHPTGVRRLVLSPFPLALGGPAPARVAAAFSLRDYSVRVTGDAEVQRLLRVAKAAGLRPTEIAATGAVAIDAAISGPWEGFAPPTLLGRASVQNVTANVRGLPEPLNLAGAAVSFTPQALRLDNLRASVPRSGLAANGWVELPRNCGVPEDCVVRFDLATAGLSTDELNRLLNPKLQSRPWYQVIGGTPRPSIFTALRAEGRVTAARVSMKNVVANRVSAHVRIEAGKLTLDQLAGEVLGGKHLGKLTADFTADPPQYAASGTLTRANMAQVTAALGDAWASGAADFQYAATFAGWDAAALARSADGAIDFAWRDGGFRNLVLRQAAGPLRVRVFQGRLELKDGKLSFAQSKLTAPGGIYEVRGTASFSRQLDLTFSDGGPASYAVTGTMAAPKVAAVPRTEAALR